MPKKAKAKVRAKAIDTSFPHQIFRDEDTLRGIFQYLPTLKNVNLVKKKVQQSCFEDASRKGLAVDPER